MTETRHRMPSIAVLLLVGGLAACGRERLEFADWIMEVPDGTPVMEYAPVPMEERDADAIRLTDELVIGADPSIPGEAVFQPSDIVATDDGHIFVADFAMSRIQMYDRDGRYLRTLGAEGQGPGEFAWLWGMAIAGEVLVVDDRGNARLSVWSLDGELLAEHPKQTRDVLFEMQGLSDGRFVARTSVTEPDGAAVVIGLYANDGVEAARLAETAPTPPPVPTPSMGPDEIARLIVGMLQDPRRAAAVGNGRLVYVSPLVEYQVHALRPDGGSAWALRVARPRAAMTPRKKSGIVQQAQRMNPAIREADFSWPDRDAAVLDILTDGRGRLYVIPEPFFTGEAPSTVPVDVFSPEGELIAAGYLPARWAEPPGYFVAPWSSAAGDYVYGRRETDTGEIVAVRYRLTLNTR